MPLYNRKSYNIFILKKKPSPAQQEISGSECPSTGVVLKSEEDFSIAPSVKDHSPSVQSPAVRGQQLCQAQHCSEMSPSTRT